MKRVVIHSLALIVCTGSVVLYVAVQCTRAAVVALFAALGALEC